MLNTVQHVQLCHVSHVKQSLNNLVVYYCYLFVENVAMMNMSHGFSFFFFFFFFVVVLLYLVLILQTLMIGKTKPF